MDSKLSDKNVIVETHMGAFNSIEWILNLARVSPGADGVLSIPLNGFMADLSRAKVEALTKLSFNSIEWIPSWF